MKDKKREQLWYNPDAKAPRTVIREGGETIGMPVEHLAGMREGQSLLETYCRFYREKR